MHIRTLAALCVAGLLSLAAGSAEAACSLPYIFANGQTADANQVNTNLDSLRDCSNALSSHLQPTITSSGSANAQTLTYSAVPASGYVNGDIYTFIVGAGPANTGATTLNVNSLGAKAIQANGAALVGGELYTGRSVSVYYDGSSFQIMGLNPYSASAGNTAVLPTLYSPANGQASNLNNTVMGVGALAASVNTPNNTALGWDALHVLTGGSDNTAVGARALLSQTNSTYNSAFGSDTLRYVTTGTGNLGVGHGAMAGSDGAPTAVVDLTGSYNTAVGNWSYQQLIGTASANTGLGMDSGTWIYTGVDNTAVGQAALGGCNAGNCNAPASTSNAASFNVAVGANALQSNTANAQTAVGYGAMQQSITGSLSTALGYQALMASTADVRNTAVGYNALPALNGANDNTALGALALVAATTGGFNTAVGSSAGAGIITGQENVHVGEGSGSAAGAGVNFNTAIGVNTLKHVTASGQTAVGYTALSALTSGADATAVGYQALKTSTADPRNTAVGYNAETLVNGGGDNTALGALALVAATTGGFNTVVGSLAGTGITTGIATSIYGAGVGATCATGTNALLLGVSSSTDCGSSSEGNVIHIGAGGTDIWKTTGTNAPSSAVSTLAGTLILPNLPTADPHVVGKLWSNSGVLTVSAG